MEDNVVRDKSLKFAIRIVNMAQFLQNEKKEYVLSKQLLRAGTAPGALIREAGQAESKADFIHKLSIAQKEIDETLYWLELLYNTSYLNEKEHTSINTDATEIIKLLISIIKTTKSINN